MYCSSRFIATGSTLPPYCSRDQGRSNFAFLLNFTVGPVLLPGLLNGSALKHSLRVITDNDRDGLYGMR